MTDLTSIVESIQSSSSADLAFEQFNSYIQDHGFDNAIYTLLNDHNSIGQKRWHGLSTSYPEDWVKHYNQNSYYDDDPVWWRLMQSTSPFYWTEALSLHVRVFGNDSPIALKALRLMREAEDAGLAGGIGMSFSNRYGELTGVGISSSQNTEEPSLQSLSDISFVAAVMHDRYRGFFSNAERVSLTLREKEVLSWSAEGKNDEDIAIILNVSKNTVRFHWKNIFEKMQTNSKLQATVKAVREKLVEPVRLESRRIQR